jgi:hypothetical protein
MIGNLNQEFSSNKPTQKEFDAIDEQAKEALFRGEIGRFAYLLNELQASKRPYAWKIESKEQLKALCKRYLFYNDRYDPEEMAQIVWDHERAHQKEATNLGINSTIRLIETEKTPSNFFSLYNSFEGYLDLSVDDLLTRTSRVPSRILAYLGRIYLAPKRDGVAHQKGETSIGNKCIAKARVFAINEFIHKNKAS